MLKIESISKKFIGNDFYSLKDVNMEINKGEIVGLIGRNGAGKSTLMKLIAKSLKPTSGLITYNGIDIHSKDNVLTDFGIMIDPVFYPEMSVIDNLKFYLRLHGKEELFSNIEPTLKLVELWKARNRKPKGFSFGMKQRTALAIAMVAEPDFLILDEHTAALDPKTAEIIMELTDKVVKEKNLTAIMVTHNLRYAVEYGSRLLMMDKGHIILDKSGFDKKNASVDDILEIFNRISIECGN